MKIHVVVRRLEQLHSTHSSQLLELGGGKKKGYSCQCRESSYSTNCKLEVKTSLDSKASSVPHFFNKVWLSFEKGLVQISFADLPNSNSALRALLQSENSLNNGFKKKKENVFQISLIDKQCNKQWFLPNST